MAHVKVERRSMSMSQWSRLNFSQIQDLIILASHASEGWKVRVGEYEPDGYLWDDPAPKPIVDGDQWGRPDGTAEFTGTIIIPPEMDGQKVWLQMRVSCEVIVHINGRPGDGLDPNRLRLVLTEKARAGDRFDLRMEAYTRSKPDDQRSFETRAIFGCVQTFRAPCAVVLDELAESVACDLHMLYEAAFNTQLDEDLVSWYQRHVREVIKIMPPYESSPQQLRAALGAMKKYLEEQVFVGPGSFGQVGKLACVAHSHLDIAYHWRVRQTIQKNARTTLIQLRLMDRHKDFLYAHTQAWCYETLEQFYPELFEELRQRIAEGRWEIVGGLYVEPDCNVISAESLARQILYGKRYFLEKFGVEVDNCWLPDVFGNSSIMPQILKAGGINYFVSNKMSTWNDTNLFPHNNFLWRGIDGTDIFACVPPVHFITWMEPNQVVESWERFLDKDTVSESLQMYGYGDGGSGANDEMIEYYRRLQKMPGMPQLRLTTGQEYLQSSFASAKGLEVWDGELYLEMHRGTFTTKGDLKRENRRGEFAAMRAEMLATLAGLGGARYPRQELTEAWKTLLVNQFHDILPGSHTWPVFVDAMNDYAAMNAKLDAVSAAALDVIAPKAGQDSLAVLNMLGFARAGVAVVDAPAGVEDAAWARDAAGTACPLQTQQVAGGGSRVVMEVGKTPALSLASAKLIKNAPAKTDTGLVARAGLLENRFFRLELDAAGRLVKLWDKRHNRDVIEPGQVGNLWQMFEDRPGMYNAWDLLDRYEDHPIDIGDWQSVEVVETGPVSAALRLRRAFGKTTAEQIIRVFANSPRIDFETFVDWREDERLLKVAFPVTVKSRHYLTDSSAGAVERPNHRNTTWEQARFEVCCHKWMYMGEGLFGVAILNDSKYGCDVKGNVMRLSLLRAPIRPDRESDRGPHRFTYSIWTDGGDWRRGGLVEAAYDLNCPLTVLTGRKPVAAESLLTVSHPALHVQSVKMDEDGQGDVIVRLIELYGTHGRSTVRPSFALADAATCDLLERPQTKAVAADGAVEVTFRPYELITLRMKKR